MDFMDIVWLALAAVIGLLVGALVHKSVTTKRIGDADELVFCHKGVLGWHVLPP